MSSEKDGSKKTRGRPRRGPKTLERHAEETDQERQLRLEQERQAQQKLRQDRLHAYQQQLSVNGLLATTSSNHHSKFPVKVCQEICQELYGIIRNHKILESRLLCESFIRTPNRLILPDYYEVVTSPMDLLKIQQKLKTGEYVNIQQFTSDIELMVNNAKNYYKESSIEYQDACELWDVFLDAKIGKEEEKAREIDEAATSRVISGIKKRKSQQLKERNKQFLCGSKKYSSLLKITKAAIDFESESRPEDAQSNPQWLLYETVKNFVESDGFKLSKLFWKPPPEKYYPDYHKEIKEPLSLQTIGIKIKRHQYSSFSKVVADMTLLFKYAKMYNMGGSLLFKAAAILEKVMKDKAEELMKDHPEICKIESKKRVKKPKKRTSKGKLQPPSSFIQGSTLDEYQLPIPKSTSNKNESLLYACLWDNCDEQFQLHSNLVYHVTNEPSGHVRQTCKRSGLDKFECLWYDCERNKKNYKPFPNIYKVIHHVKSVHLKHSSILSERQKKKNVLAAIASLPYDPTTLDVKTFLPVDASVTQPTANYVFQGKCKKCNFSDMMVSAETTGLVLKCMLCPTTKVIGIEDPSVENTCPKSKARCIKIPQATSIQQELILPDGGLNQSFLDSSLEPTSVKRDQDESTTESQVKEHLGSLFTMHMREDSNCSSPPKRRKKATYHYNKHLTQPVVAQQVPTDAHLQGSGNYLSKVSDIEFSQEASIKEEIIVPEDVTSVSLSNSSLEPSSVNKMFCLNQDVNTPVEVLPVDLNLVKKEEDGET